MKFIPLVWSGIRRKRARSLLILLQVLVAFTLFGVLQGLDTGIQQAIARTHADRLYVMNRLSQSEPLPLALLPRIASLPGVRSVNYRVVLPLTYRRPDQFVAAIATDPVTFMRVFPETVVSRAQVAALEASPTGALVGSVLAAQYGWKLGDRIPLSAPIPRRDGSSGWAFDVVGTYTQRDHPDSANGLILNYAYVNEARLSNRNTVSYYTVLAADPTKSVSVAHEIDAAFANSPNETRTISETELAQAQIRRIGDIDLLAHVITAAAFAALLVATSALMMQSIRERVPELAVLKALGFSDQRIVTLILAEVLALCLAGAALGFWVANAVLPRARQYIGVGSVPAAVFGVGLLCAVALALASAAVPAWWSARLQIANALARR
ncbi:MAG: ABC transporter permease [Steroidobacteraceae bacterium]